METVEETEDSSTGSSDGEATSAVSGYEENSDASSIEVLSREGTPTRRDRGVNMKKRVIQIKKSYEDLRRRYERRSRIARMRIDVLQREVRLLKKLVDKDRIRRLRGKTNFLIQVKEEQRTVERL